MNLSVCNIAWGYANRDRALDILNQNGIRCIDAAPTLLCQNMESCDPFDITNYYRKYSIRIAAMQSLLYPFPHISLFDDTHNRFILIEHLRKVFSFSYKLGVRNLVFGSPKNRLVRDHSVFSREMAVDIFRELACVADEYNCTLCFEANPTHYDCNFMTRTPEAIEFVREVNHECFRLNFDISTVLLNGENLDSVFADGVDIVQHIHLSSPFIRDIIDLDHSMIRKTLERHNYKGCLSMECVFSEDDELLRLEKNVRCFAQNYKDMEGQTTT